MQIGGSGALGLCIMLGLIGCALSGEDVLKGVFWLLCMFILMPVIHHHVSGRFFGDDILQWLFTIAVGCAICAAFSL